MRSDGLKRLYEEMKKDEIKRYKFRFEYNHVELEVIFFADSKPFELLFGVIGTRFSFIANVNRGFDIDIVLPSEKYYGLLDALNIPRGGGNPFRMIDFFRYFNGHMPRYNKSQPKVCSSDVGRYRSDFEESDKIYLCGWIDQTVAGNQVRNLEKTRILLGEDAYRICRDKNISTRWTSDPSREIEANF